MSELRKHILNAPVKYYVDQECCIDHCCYDRFPSNFKWDEESCRTYVFKQPETKEEEAACEEAVRYCPVVAIRADGDLSLWGRILKVFF